MKYITLIIGLLVVGLLSVGCGKGGEITIGEPPKEEPAMSTDSIKALRDSVVGEYEHKYKATGTHKKVFLANGVYESYLNGKKLGEDKWSIVNEESGRPEIHSGDDYHGWTVSRINIDGSLTNFAWIEDGIRIDLPKRSQTIWKKIN